MSVRKSRVRPVPDFTRAHQLIELQLEARKKETKCTKVEEFNLSKPSFRSDCSNATPVRCLDFSKASPRHPDIMQLQTNLVPSPLVSSDVKVPKPKDCVMNCEPGLQKKASGILKNAGRMDEATTGQQQVHCAGAPVGRRPRVTFDVASPMRKSPISVARRVPITGWSSSPSKMSPKPSAAKMFIPSDRILVELNRTAMSVRTERQQPQRVPLLGSGQRICTSQSCSRTTFSGGFSRVRTDSVAKVIDFNEETEEGGKSVSEDDSKNSQKPLDTETAVRATNKRFGGLKKSPVRKIHVDVREGEDSSVCSPLLRINSNSDVVVRSPLLRKIERIERKDAKNGSRIPQPQDLKGKVVDKENRSKSVMEKKRKSRVEKESTGAGDNSQLVKIIESNGCKTRNSRDELATIEATSPSVKADAMEQHESADTFDANQTINKLEKKAQRLRRRSQLTEEKSELDSIMRKLEALEKKIKSMRMGLHSVRQTNSSNSAGGISSNEHSVSASANLKSESLMRNELNMCPTERLGESQLILDVKLDASALESKIESQSREDMECETPIVASEVESESKEDTEVSNALAHTVLMTERGSREDTKLFNPLIYVETVAVVETESKEDAVSDVPYVSSETDSRSYGAFEPHVPHLASEIQSKDDVLCNVPHGVPVTELLSEADMAPDVEHISSEIESRSKEDFESHVPYVSSEIESSSKEDFESCVPHISSEIESRRMEDLESETALFPLAVDSSEWKENIDPLSKIATLEDVSVNNDICTAADNPLHRTKSGDHVVFQDITEEMLSRAPQFDEDESVFVVEESSDSELMHSGDFTEWSSSPVALMNQCMTSIESELSTELSVALSPEDDLAERLAKFSISDRLETSNVEASPNMSSEFMQYKGYEWREGVDGAARLFNPVAAALIDAEADDVHFVPISPSP